MYVVHLYLFIMGFPGDLDGKESACNAGDLGSIPGLGRSPGEGNGYPLQYSCLENSKDRGVWKAIVTWVTKELDRTEQLTLTYSCIDGHLFLIFLSASFSCLSYSLSTVDVPSTVNSSNNINISSLTLFPAGRANAQ